MPRTIICKFWSFVAEKGFVIMIKKEFLWTSEYGMHARPAGMLVSKASEFESNIVISSGKGTASAKGLFSLMGLGVKKGSKLSITFEGTDEEKASQSITNFLKDGFAEEL